jgi:hypothetical protein
MWTKASQDLSDLLSNKVYPILRGIPEYERLLVGGVPNRVACNNAAARIVQEVRDSRGVKEFGSRQSVSACDWTGELFRAVSPRNNPYGVWWFDAELVRRWERTYPVSMPRQQRRENIYESLRPMLAVCYDWNDFTQLWVMRWGGASIPVITGQGAGQPIHSVKSEEHQKYKNVIFIGGYPQVYVPFVQRDRVVQYLL